ncbi:helix-turn-helix domain-containing protein [Intestinirhabdus alba]|jgi:DNA-binding CsgD family transcriptional regulator|uniref:HTH luxR-type domain-containing protein n=1 Tax=Intestinirhabdus alba TaxID=2899544 RepID=A0A6L6IP17_9ENTR|nr:LuxR C-terminal-related transcriptional regulator [Intestinirhabdus alba]MTH48622.1 hypothetical protein [Intestinirhabdus alba]
MLIITDNQYLKLGLKTLLQKEINDAYRNHILFDSGPKLYFLQAAECPDSVIPCFFELLIEGHCCAKEDIKSIDDLIKNLQRIKNDNKKRSSRELTEIEYVVIRSLCAGYTPLELANFLNRSIKTISTQKSRALRKIGMRNMQTFHGTIMRWSTLVGTLNINSPQNNCNDCRCKNIILSAENAIAYSYAELMCLTTL